MIEPVSTEIEVAGARLHTTTWGAGTPDLVVLHDGLGSVAQWRSFPRDLAMRTNLTVLAYDRAGHGASTPVPTGPWPTRWLHDEAIVLGELLRAFGTERPAIVGHSDGGSIAALHAATGGELAALVLLAAHSWVEPAAVEEISAMVGQRDAIVARLARFHADPQAVFDAWSGVWTSDAFRRWDIRPMLGSIGAPTLVIQGDRDEYATPDQAVETVRAIGANATLDLLPGGRHLLHHSAPDLLIDRVSTFLTEHHAGASPAFRRDG